MKKIIGILLSFSILLSGCADKSNDTYNEVQNSIADNPPVSIPQTDRSEEATKKDLSGTLSISTYYDTQMLKRAEEFMAIYPNVQIEIKLTDPLENLDQYGLRMATELMSGKAADIVDMAHFTTFKYAKSGLLCDLYEFMNSDPAFDKSDYYTNIFGAKEKDGKLYTMPFYFTYDMLYVSKPLTEQLGKKYVSFDYKKMLELYNEVVNKADGKDNPLFMPGVTKDFFFRYEFPAFYDTALGVATFNSEHFIQYLEQTDSIVTPFDPVNMQWDKTRIAGNDDFMKEDYLFCQLDVSTADTFNFLIDYKNIHAPIPLKSTKGDELFLTLIAEYGISSNSTNKELAWEFIKFCIEEKEPPEGTDWDTVTAYVNNYHGWIPINTNNFFHVFRKACEADLDMFGNKLEVEWKDGDRDTLITEALEEIHQWNSERNRPQSETEIYHLISSDLDNFYYYDVSSAEETATIIQAKMNAYLNE